MADESIKVRFIGDDSSFQAAARRTNVALDKTGKAVGKTGKDFTNFGRVLQDLPYGFQGVQNNLTQLIPSVGALGLAFTALVSAVTFIQVGFGAWTRGMGGASSAANEHTAALRKAQEALRDYVDSLDDINKARVTGAQNAQEELVQLQTLYQATQNANIPLADRKKLVDELQDQYPKYFGNIRDEIILAGGAEAAYKKLSASILQSARARAAQEGLTEIQKELIPLEQQHTELLQKQSDAYQRLRKEEEYTEKRRAKMRQGSQPGLATTFNSRQLGGVQREYNEALGETADLWSKISELQGRAAKLTDEITKTVEATPEALLDPGEAIKKLKDVKFETNFFDKFLSFDPTKVAEKSKEFAEAWKTFTEFALTNQGIFVGLDDILAIDSKPSAIKAADQWWKDFQKGVYRFKMEPIEIPEVDPKTQKSTRKRSEIEIKLTAKPTIEYKATDFEKKIADFQKGIASVIESTLENGAIAIGEGIGAALAGGGLDKVFASIGAVVGGFIQDLGKMLIKTAIQVKAFKTAIEKLVFTNPLLAIGIGVGLVAIGAAIKNSMPQFKGFNKGGIVPGVGNTDSVAAMLTPGELVIPKDMVQRMRSPRGNSSVMGTGGFSGGRLVGELRMHARELIAGIALETSSQRRAFG
jgi:hypothetical protein